MVSGIRGIRWEALTGHLDAAYVAYLEHGGVGDVGVVPELEGELCRSLLLLRIERVFPVFAATVPSLLMIQIL